MTTQYVNPITNDVITGDSLPTDFVSPKLPTDSILYARIRKNSTSLSFDYPPNPTTCPGEDVRPVTKQGESGPPYCYYGTNTTAPTCCNNPGYDASCPEGFDVIRYKMISNHTSCDDILCVSGKCFSSCQWNCAKFSIEKTCQRGETTVRCQNGTCIQQCLNPTCEIEKVCGDGEKDGKTCFCYMKTNQCQTDGSQNWEPPVKDDRVSTNLCLDAPTAWVICEFYYDFSDYNVWYDTSKRYTYSSIMPVSLYDWSKDLLLTNTEQNPYLPSPFLQWTFLTFFITHCTTLFYSSFYCDPENPPFNTTKIQTSYFQNCSVFIGRDDNYFKKYITDNITEMITDWLQLYESQLQKQNIYLNSNIFDYSNNLFLFPRLQYNESNNTSEIILTLSVNQFTTLSKDPATQNVQLSKLLNNLLRTNISFIQDITKSYNKESIPPCNIQFSRSSFNYFNLNIQNFQLDQQTESMDGTYFLVSVNMICTVLTFSPLLYLYAANSYQDFLNDHVCPGTEFDRFLPMICWINSDCRNDPKCFQTTTVKQCRYNIQSSVPTIVSYQDDMALKQVLSKRSDDCLCLTSNIAPPTQSQYNNKTSLCFDNYCTDPLFVSAYDLSDTTCRQYCPVLDTWKYSTQPENKIQNEGEVNDVKYNRLCGKWTKRYVDVYVLIELLFISIFLCILLYSLLQKQPSKFLQWSIVGICFLVLLAFSIYLSYELNGDSYCEDIYLNAPYQCQSQLTQFKLPSFQCHTYQFCDCAFNNQCPTNMQCNSGQCFNNDDPSMQYNVQYSTVYNYIYGILLWILLLLVLITGSIFFRKQPYGMPMVLMICCFILSFQFFCIQQKIQLTNSIES